MIEIDNEIKRKVELYGCYRHYKKEIDGEDMIYCVNGISNPCNYKEIEIVESSADEQLTFHHTELDYDISITRILGNHYYHYNGIDKEPLVIYTAMYGKRETYVSPLSMFLDKVIINNKEENRFNLI